MIQQYHSQGYTQRNVTQVIPKAPAHHVYCITIHNSQAMETAKMPHYQFKKMWYLYTMEFYSVTKKNEIFFHSQVSG
jgi:hypothetical protein